MSSTTRSTRSSIRLRRAGTIAAAAVIALSATVGLGVAPASAAAPITNHVTFSTNWTVHGQNVMSFRVVGSTFVPRTRTTVPFDKCYSFGDYRRDKDRLPSFGVDLSPSVYRVTSYGNRDCTAGYKGTLGLVDSSAPNWTLSTSGMPRRSDN